MLTTDKKIKNAYKYCLAIAQNHYENFPVASKLLNKQLRFPIAAVYAFARSADDFADEGDRSDEQRLSLLNEYRIELDEIQQTLTQRSDNKKQPSVHTSDNKIFIALADVILQYQIPIGLFYDLLNAFRQDVITSRYTDFDEILAYCKLSANPVGRILLHLNHSASEKNCHYSDAICTGLQLINFYQDIAQDIDESDRLYLPLNEMEQYKVSINDIKNQRNTSQAQKLITIQLQRARQTYESGKPLCFNLSGTFALEIRMIYSGGKLILDKLEENSGSIYRRPRLNAKDKIKIIWQAVFFKYYFSTNK